MLKSRGYRWRPGNSGRPGSWWVEKEEREYLDETAFLKRQSLVNENEIDIEKVTALNRFKLVPNAKTQLG
jgi:hypothetical protein